MASIWDPPTGSAFSDRVIAPVLQIYLAGGGNFPQDRDVVSA
jgi:hypothetical protein